MKHSKKFLHDEKAWTDFVLSNLGIIIFAVLLLIIALKVYPMFVPSNEQIMLDNIARGVTSKIESVASSTISGVVHEHIVGTVDSSISVSISSEYVTATKTGTGGVVHSAQPLLVKAYPPNSMWATSSSLRDHMSIYFGASGAQNDPLDVGKQSDVGNMFNDIGEEVARTPLSMNLSQPLLIEKIILYYDDGASEDYVIVYQQ